MRPEKWDVSGEICVESPGLLFYWGRGRYADLPAATPSSGYLDVAAFGADDDQEDV